MATIEPAAGRVDTPTAAPPAIRKRPKDDTVLALVFIAPALVGFVAFLLWPTLRGIYLSFTKFNLLTPPQWVGVANYQRMFSDSIFWNAVWVTLEYVLINIGVQTILALLIAVLMQRLTKSTFVRGVMLAPYLVSNVVVALTFLWILDPQLGIANHVLGWFGIAPQTFFTSATTAIPTIALVNVWRHMGYTALLIFAGLQTIPETVYEAAKMDGSSEWSMFWRITMPLLRPILALVLIMTIVGSFQVYDTVAIATQGGPVNASRVLQYYIYDMAFGRFQFGYASALSVGLLVVLMIVTFVQYRLSRAGESDLA